MGLKLTIKSPAGYVRAVSGLFITKEYPSGLTIREMQIIASLINHSKSGVLTFASRKKTMDELEIKSQHFYNAMVVLKRKGVLVEDELHRIFTSSNLTINYASDS